MTEKKESYESIKKITERPIKDRVEVRNKKGNLQVPRRHHLTKEELDKIIEQKKTLSPIGGDVFINPYTRKGICRFTVDALHELGLNEWHNFIVVRDKIEETMSKVDDPKGNNLWEKFVNRKPRSSTGKDYNGRLLATFKTLQRLNSDNPYGYKLSQVCACIDIRADNGTFQYRLNTKFDSREEVFPITLPKGKRGRKPKNQISDTK